MNKMSLTLSMLLSLVVVTDVMASSATGFINTITKLRAENASLKAGYDAANKEFDALYENQPTFGKTIFGRFGNFAGSKISSGLNIVRQNMPTVSKNTALTFVNTHKSEIGGAVAGLALSAYFLPKGETKVKMTGKAVVCGVTAGVSSLAAGQIRDTVVPQLTSANVKACADSTLNGAKTLGNGLWNAGKVGYGLASELIANHPTAAKITVGALAVTGLYGIYKYCKPAVKVKGFNIPSITITEKTLTAEQKDELDAQYKDVMQNRIDEL